MLGFVSLDIRVFIQEDNCHYLCLTENEMKWLAQNYLGDEGQSLWRKCDPGISSLLDQTSHST